MEENKSIFRLMLAITAFITVVGMVWAVLTCPDTWQSALALLACNAFFSAGVYLGIRHPEWNNRYGLKRVNGKLRWGRTEQPADPEGLRYRYLGFVLPAFALLMAAETLFDAQSDTFSVWFSVLAILLVIAMVAIIAYVEYLLRRQQ